MQCANARRADVEASLVPRRSAKRRDAMGARGVRARGPAGCVLVSVMAVGQNRWSYGNACSPSSHRPARECRPSCAGV